MANEPHRPPLSDHHALPTASIRLSEPSWARFVVLWPFIQCQASRPPLYFPARQFGHAEPLAGPGAADRVGPALASPTRSSTSPHELGRGYDVKKPLPDFCDPCNIRSSYPRRTAGA